MEKALEINEQLMNEAIKCLEKGYCSEDFHVLSQSLDNIKDIKTIQSMDQEIGTKSKLSEHLNKYEQTSNISELDKCMKCMQQMISEIHEKVKTDEEKNIVKEHLKLMFNMFI